MLFFLPFIRGLLRCIASCTGFTYCKAIWFSCSRMGYAYAKYCERTASSRRWSTDCHCISEHYFEAKRSICQQMCFKMTNPRRYIRALLRNAGYFSFVFTSPDNNRTWAFPHSDFNRNLGGQHEKLVNSLAFNEDGVLASDSIGILCLCKQHSAHFLDRRNSCASRKFERRTEIYEWHKTIPEVDFLLAKQKKLLKCEKCKGAWPETHSLIQKPDYVSVKSVIHLDAMYASGRCLFVIF